MNKQIQELAAQAANGMLSYDAEGDWRLSEKEVEKFAELIVYDFLSELTNDDALGEARIDTIKRLAEKWGVAR